MVTAARPGAAIPPECAVRSHRRRSSSRASPARRRHVCLPAAGPGPWRRL